MRRGPKPSRWRHAARSSFEQFFVRRSGPLNKAPDEATEPPDEAPHGEGDAPEPPLTPPEPELPEPPPVPAARPSPS